MVALFLGAAVVIAGLVYRLVSIVRARRQRDRQSAGVIKHLQVMGYNATPYGIDVALVLLQEGYNDVEAAMHIAHVVLARDVRAAGDDIDKLTGYVPHGMVLLHVLKEYKDGGAIRPALWEK
jgi:hypothetical protein